MPRRCRDIYAALAKNITTQCGSSRPGVTWIVGSSIPKGVITVGNAGYTEYHVCGDLTISGSGYLTGNPSNTDTVIVVENGSLNVDDGGQINTVRTAIVLTGSNRYASSINFPNGKGHAATLAVSPPTSSGDPWQGVSIYQDPALTTSVNDTWGPGATFNADGVVYLPQANLVIHGSSASNRLHKIGGQLVHHQWKRQSQFRPDQQRLHRPRHETVNGYSNPPRAIVRPARPGS